MKRLFIVANWKSNVTIQEVNSWLLQLKNSKWNIENKTIIVCPPFTLLSLLKQRLNEHKLPIEVGAQDISPFPKGAYTGEIAADQLAEYVSYVIIGHSERRKYFREADQMLSNKVDMALQGKITPIFCVQDATTVVPRDVSIVAYEPVFAIGTGNPDTPESAEKVSMRIREENKNVRKVLYGGSVTDKNVNSFISRSSIDGVLVGSASLDPVTFSHIITNA
jgi:triosephosphate isomerase (TIM)